MLYFTSCRRTQVLSCPEYWFNWFKKQIYFSLYLFVLIFVPGYLTKPVPSYPTTAVPVTENTISEYSVENKRKAGILSTKLLKLNINTIVICFCYRIFIPEKDRPEELWYFLVSEWAHHVFTVTHPSLTWTSLRDSVWLQLSVPSSLEASCVSLAAVPQCQLHDHCSTTI